jgi:hypothetical protein
MDSAAAKGTEMPAAPPEMEEPEAATVAPDNSAAASFELPFLVTHWLAHYPESANDDNDDDNNNNEQAQQARQRIRRAAAELSTAFYALGSFGTTTRVGSCLRRGRVCVCVHAGWWIGSLFLTHTLLRALLLLFSLCSCRV